MFHCDKCDKDYKTSATLKKHSCKPFIEPICEYCDKLLSNKKSLNRHYIICKKKILFDEQKQEEKIQKCVEILKNNPKKVDELLNDTSSITNIITNVDTINIQNNYVVLNIDESKLDHIVKDILIDFFKREEKNKNDTFTCNLINYIHCNPDIPENHNIYVSDFSRKILKYRLNNIRDILTTVINYSEEKVLYILSELRINKDKDKIFFEQQWWDFQDKVLNNKNNTEDYFDDNIKTLISNLYNNKLNIKKLN